MVDSRNVDAMPDGIDDGARRVQTIEVKLDLLTASLDGRFDAVDAAFIEQRQYTEFAFEKLERVMNSRFGDVEACFGDGGGHGRRDGDAG
jgi:hypothetical protein